MTKIIVTAGAIAATVAAIALFSLPGIASAAPDLVGQTYAEATNAIAQQGGTAIIASRVGAKLPPEQVHRHWRFSIDIRETSVRPGCPWP